jgi:hypothetical protein
VNRRQTDEFFNGFSAYNRRTLMPRYYFSITNGRPFKDIDGLELPDLDAARAEAIGFARDLMRTELAQDAWSSWTVRVTDGMHEVVLNIAFSEAT